MDFSYKIIRASALSTTKWSGGTTTELAIYPESAKYSDRNFLWRVSTATVELDESEFTLLPGIHRKIMVLNGKMLLRHEGHGEMFMEPYEQKAFMGDWHTRSFGRVADFNLMTAEGCEGHIEAIKVSPANIIEANVFTALGNKGYDTVFEVFYFLSHIDVSMLGMGTVEMHKGDVLMLQSTSNNVKIVEFDNINTAQAHVIRASVYVK